MATYLDNAGVTQILTKIKSLLAKKAEITAIPTKVSQLTNDSSYQTNSEVDTAITNKLNTLDLTSEDIPSTLDEGAYFISSLTQENGLVRAKKVQFANQFTANLEAAQSQGDVVSLAQLSQKITDAVGKITSFEYNIVPHLPPIADGKVGTVYLVPNEGSGNNVYDEYIFLPPDSPFEGRYEKIGTTDIDLTPYAKKTEIPTKVSQLTNDSDFETKENVGSRITGAINSLDKADTAVEGKYVSAVSETNGVITVTRESLPAVGTADSPISNTTIESIFTQVFG